MRRRRLVLGSALALVLALVAILVMLRRRGETTPVAAKPSGATGGGLVLPGGGRGRPGQGGGGDGGAAALAGRLVVKGAWGSGPAEFGHREAHESNPEGPMALAAGKHGVVVLDQANARITRFNPDGSVAAAFTIGPDTAQDVAVDANGRVAVLDRVHEGQVLLYDEQGKLIGQVPVVGGPLTEAGGTTGVFADATGTYVEREHTEIVRLLGPDGQPDPNRPTSPGRPLRDGSGYLNAALANRAGGTASVRVWNLDAQLLWQRAVGFGAPILSLVMLDSDLRGHVYVAAHVGVESPSPPYTISEERIVLWRLVQSDGSPAGSLTLPAPTVPEETFRALSVSDDGIVYQMIPTANGMEVRAYGF